MNYANPPQITAPDLHSATAFELTRYVRLHALLVGAICFLGVQTRGSVYVGGGELSLRATLAHEYDSNIYGNNREIADQHTIATPEAVFLRDKGAVTLDARAGVKGHRFAENSAENSWDPFYQAKLNWKREEDKAEGLLDASLRRMNEANPDVNTRTESDEIRVDTHFGQFPTAKLGYRVAVNYSDSDFASRQFSDLRAHSIEVGARYLFSPRYDLFLSAARRRSSTYYVPSGMTAMNSTDQKLKFGVAGEIFPKLTGEAAVGWVRRKADAIGWRQSTLLIDTALTWHPDDDTSVTLTVVRDFDTTPLDQSVLEFESGIQARRQLHDKWGVGVGVSHVRARYIGGPGGRRDNHLRGRLSMDYQFAPRFRAEGWVSYHNSDSTLRIADYSRFIVGAALTAVF